MSTKPTLLIGLVGKAGAGKDTLAAQFGPCPKLAFAAPLKQALMVMFDFCSTQVHTALKDEVDERWGISPREAMTKFGTDIMQAWIGSDFWVRRMEIELEWVTGHPLVLVTDVRFPAEVEMIRRRGGVIVEIVRPNQDISYRDPKTLNHVSEQLQVQADFTVINDKDLDHLHQEAQRILKELKRD